MDYDNFLKLLKEANLTKSEFREFTKTKLGTYNGWGTARLGKKTPSWTRSWLKLYIDNKNKDIVIEALKS